MAAPSYSASGGDATSGTGEQVFDGSGVFAAFNYQTPNPMMQYAMIAGVAIVAYLLFKK